MLSQSFLDDLERPRVSHVRLPPFFSNLLPEGVLRDLIASQTGVKPEREFFLLARLGEDLPGAVIARPLEPVVIDELEEPGISDQPLAEMADGLRFSLAGVQLKFSALRSDRGLTIPVHGTGGDHLVKLPDNRYENVPANEYWTMSWAREAGLQVPPCELVDVGAIHGLPPEIASREKLAFAIPRFDRTPGGRIHIEDFAQVLAISPDDKYRAFNYETIARILLATCGRKAVTEFVGRLVFTVISGNADMHLKNWSLRYPDGLQAELAPAYDLVSTIQYPETSTRLALRFARSKRFEDVDRSGFRRLARKLGLSEPELEDEAMLFASRIVEAFHHLRERVAPPAGYRDRLREHTRRVPLLAGLTL